MGFIPIFSKQAYLYKEQSQAQRIIQHNQKKHPLDAAIITSVS
jgi:hypothetical protein